MSASLNEAAMAGNLEEVTMRLNLGEDVNQKLYPRFSTPLHDATICGRIDVVKLLIERGADVNIPDYKGMTPLKASRRYGQEEIEEMLVAQGAKLEVEVQKPKPCSDGVAPPWKRQISRRDEISSGQ
ncbi:hypothetical protein TCAL_08180 [Tigriopus californicus]|uniref:Uncharacterized protein n=1 Tax=Tigriopus californicus TaxID=6832 RepID=A0A553P7E9_TIGCA|nr:myotrophin-like [Tigriopus californicus]TRY73605.1 hypothetical protein TCAL_08180 [Tigriopus californicus]|eukprot:TCALIF_08180-PA protein Name:"Similar to TNKS Tankyrase-1 (Homo sapiens)" AED:0.00 eAED:0.00 QI:80/1/1/1/1/1/2/100/126